MKWCLGFRVWGLGFWVWGLGFGAWGLGFRASEVVLGTRVWGLGAHFDKNRWGSERGMLPILL